MLPLAHMHYTDSGNWFAKIAGAALMMGVVVKIWLNGDYGSVTGAMHQNPAIAVYLTAGICFLYSEVMNITLAQDWGLAVGFKPLSTMVAYSGVVLTVGAQDSLLHLSLAGYTFAGMATDLLLIGGGLPVHVCAIVCMTLVMVMLADTKLRHLKELELMFGIVFPVGVLLSGL